MILTKSEVCVVLNRNLPGTVYNQGISEGELLDQWNAVEVAEEEYVLR